METKEIMYSDVPNAKGDEWKRGYLMGFGVDYENQENGLGIACGSITKAIVKTRQGLFKLLPLDQIFEE